MKIPRIADAISKIDDDLIIESEEKYEKKSKVTWLKVGITVASLCLIVIGIIIVRNSFTKNINDNMKADTATINLSEAYGFTLEGKDNLIFSPISFSDRKKYNLVPENAIGLTPENTYVITEKDLGSVIGKVGNCENSTIIGKMVYHFSSYPDSDICILDNDGKYEFYTYGYYIDLSDAKNSDEIMTAHGLPDTCVQVEVCKADLSRLFTITDNQTVKEICSLLSGCENIGREASEKLFANAWFEAYGNDDVYYNEAKGVCTYRGADTHELAHELWNKGEKCLYIVNNEGYSVFVDFFPSIGVFFVSNGQFLLTKESVDRLNGILDNSALEIKDLQDDKQSTEIREKRQDEYLEDMVNKMIEEQGIDDLDEKEYYRQKLLGEN